MGCSQGRRVERDANGSVLRNGGALHRQVGRECVKWEAAVADVEKIRAQAEWGDLCVGEDSGTGCVAHNDDEMAVGLQEGHEELSRGARIDVDDRGSA